MSDRVKIINFTFTLGTTEAKRLDGKSIIGFITPASLGATEITLKASQDLEGTYYDVYDCSNDLINFVVDTSAARHYDVTDDFPASVENVKFVANASISGKTLQVIVKNT